PISYFPSPSSSHLPYLPSFPTRRSSDLEHDVVVETCGKVVVATDEVEVERLGAICERAQANGVPGLAMLDRDGLRTIEPHAEGVAALHSPHTAIIDYPGLTEALIADVRSRGGRIRLSTPVKDIRR